MPSRRAASEGLRNSAELPTITSLLLTAIL